MPSTPPFRPPWGVTPRQAAALQSEWAHLVVTRNDLPAIRRVAGIDVGFEDHGRIARAAVAVLTFPGLTLAESVVHRAPTAFPYVPGLLSFREIAPVLEALERLEHPPDLLVCDGQGRAHPRRFGLACHLGVLTGLPSIGAAKSRLIGTHGEPGPERGDVAWLHDHDEIIGAVLRTRRNVRPLFVSIGHRIDLPTAVDWTLRVTPRYRLPETTRHAHRLASGP